MSKKAFTLAEVLITLMIIGVIAAITVPTVKDSADERTWVAGATKAYTLLSTITGELQLEKGPAKFWATSSSDVASLYKKKMSISDKKYSSYSTKYLNQNTYTNANMFDESTSFVTSDGMLYYIQSVSSGCNGGNASENPDGTTTPASTNWANGCIDWGVDVNGSALPNTVGYDIFGFYVNKKGELLPERVLDEVIDTTSCSSAGNGWSCSQKIVTERKITW